MGGMGMGVVAVKGSCWGLNLPVVREFRGAERFGEGHFSWLGGGSLPGPGGLCPPAGVSPVPGGVPVPPRWVGEWQPC